MIRAYCYFTLADSSALLAKLSSNSTSYSLALRLINCT